MDELLKCPSCKIIFQSPRLLDCNHILCLGCLEKQFKPGVSPYITCVMCDKDTLVLHANLDNLPQVPAVEELLKYRNGGYDRSFQPMRISESNPNSNSSLKLITALTKISNDIDHTQKSLKTPRSPRKNNKESHSSGTGNSGATTTTTTSTSSREPVKHSPSFGSFNKVSGNKVLNALKRATSPPPVSISATKSPISASQSASSNQLVTPPLSSANASTSSNNTSGALNISTTPPLHSSSSPLTNSTSSMISEEVMDQLIRCPAHQEFFKFYCTECEKLICLECIISHNGHQFNKIPLELEKKIQDIEGILVSVAINPNKLLKQKQSVEKKLIESQGLYRETKQRITNDIDTMIRNLQERKEQLESQIDREWADQKQQLTDQIQKITTNINKIQESTSQSQAFLQEYQSQLFSQRQRSQTITTPSHYSGTFSSAHLDKVSASLLRQFYIMKQLDEEAGLLCNDEIINIDWKWDPEFQFPQLFSKANGQPTTVIYRKRTMSNATPYQHHAHAQLSPLGASPNVPSPGSTTPTLPTHTPISQELLQKVNLSLSTSSIPNLQISPNALASTSIIQNPVTKQNSFVISIKGGRDRDRDRDSLPPLFNIAPSASPTEGSSSPTHPKIHFKNPVFGKLLTKKESCIALRKHYIYGFGNSHAERAIEIYDTLAGKWKFGAACPVTSNDFSCVYDGLSYVYLFGGKESPTEVHKYSVDSNTWEKVPSQIPSKKFGHCTVFDGVRYIYLVGGGVTSKSLDRFDTTNHTWTKLKPMAHGRVNFNCFYNSTKKCIYAVDGYVNKDKHSSIEMYDIEHGQWSEIAVINQPRYFAGVSFDSTRYIHIVGGIDRSNSKDLNNNIVKFDTLTKTWESLDTMKPSVSTSASLSNSTSNTPPLGQSSPLAHSTSHASFSSNSSFSLSQSTSALTNPNHSGSGPIPTDKIQFFISSLFDGDQYFYYLGINVDEAAPLLYRFNIKSKKFEKLISSSSQLNLFSQIVLVSK